MKIYQQIASTLIAANNCRARGECKWLMRHNDRLDELVAQLPSGSGLDNGVTLGDDATPDKLIFYTAFHHMDDNGSYDGWTKHTITVRPSLAFDIDLKISGSNRNDIKDYLAELFQHALTQDATE